MCISTAKSIAMTGHIVSILGAIISFWIIVAAIMNFDWICVGSDSNACHAIFIIFSPILLVLSLISLVADLCLIGGSDEIRTRPGGPNACACYCDWIIAKIIVAILCLALAMYLTLFVSTSNDLLVPGTVLLILDLFVGFGNFCPGILLRRRAMRDQQTIHDTELL